MSEEIKREKLSALEELTPAKTFHRFSAAGFDFALFFVLSILFQLLSSFILTQKNLPFGQAYDLQYNHVIAADLSKYVEDRGYISFENDDFYQKEDDNYFIINHLSYYYLSYLTGINLKTDYIASLEKDELIEGITKSEYYTVKWFNEKILSLGSDGSDNDYFTYQKDGDTINFDKIGTLQDKYIEVVDGKETVIKNENLYKKTNEIYKSAIKHFYNQKFIKSATNLMNTTNSFIILFSSLIPMIIFYIIIPSLSIFGMTLGKRIMSLILVNDNGFIVKKWQHLLRCIPLLASLIFISFINNLYISIIFCVVLALTSLSFMIFTQKNQAIHDFIARTAVIKNDGKKIYRSKEEYNLFLELSAERKNENER